MKQTLPNQATSTKSELTRNITDNYVPKGVFDNSVTNLSDYLKKLRMKPNPKVIQELLEKLSNYSGR